MNINRRKFITTLGIAAISTQIPSFTVQAQTANTIIKPPRLRLGDTVGLISPAGIIDSEDVEQAKQTFTALGLKVKLGSHILDNYGYLAGIDRDRAGDVNAMFGDKSVKAIIAMRGGWGGNRILPLLNYNYIRANPKIIMGYSDITSLLLAITAQTGLVTFHGAVATSTWNNFTLNYVKSIIFNGELVTMNNTLATQLRRQIITPGKAKGKFIGGNLSVINSMLGSSYLPNWKNSILFIEDIGEDVYRVDRMITQLKNAGILNQLSGFVFGQCTRCSTGNEPSLTLMQVLQEHIRPLNIPAWYGSMIGHIKDKFTLPIGIQVEIDANTGIIKMLEAAVS
ncbi:LD-carboxypeptidase [Plectonema cf. radiosum LEGE 06105]|uniref:LD-carboxypeptidase n=1 Tax=Plectonema cf. radiosum LEGE 06105 TaxID=945769 RepID=A0A8J7FGZ3_9CYAN|nr:LD-carboxypeptidase [Plectonema radiosum]MBE9216173.1 LD-carboxypeptidase [Plectonema cf. radiosum LEGE 06105]